VFLAVASILVSAGVLVAGFFAPLRDRSATEAQQGPRPRAGRAATDDQAQSGQSLAVSESSASEAGDVVSRRELVEPSAYARTQLTELLMASLARSDESFAVTEARAPEEADVASLRELVEPSAYARTQLRELRELLVASQARSDESFAVTEASAPEEADVASLRELVESSVRSLESQLKVLMEAQERTSKSLEELRQARTSATLSSPSRSTRLTSEADWADAFRYIAEHGRAIAQPNELLLVTLQQAFRQVLVAEPHLAAGFEQRIPYGQSLVDFEGWLERYSTEVEDRYLLRHGSYYRLEPSSARLLERIRRGYLDNPDDWAAIWPRRREREELALLERLLAHLLRDL